MYKFNMVEDAIKDIKEGKIIIVVDDPDRENEGDLLMAAEKVTGEAINFMTKYGRGLICIIPDSMPLLPAGTESPCLNHRPNRLRSCQC